MPWTTDKESLQLDWQLRNSYIALAQDVKSEVPFLKNKLLERCALSIQRYVQYQVGSFYSMLHSKSDIIPYQVG